MRIAVLGGGPGGLYFAALAKQLDARHDITVWERNAAGDTFVAKSSPFFASEPPSITIVAWAGIWLVLVLVLAVTQLRRREL